MFHASVRPDDQLGNEVSMPEDTPRTVLVVDAANVIGAVPDGWWRDRAGAAARLHSALLTADLPYDAIVLVVEGKARNGVAEGLDGTVMTVPAAGSGDDEIVAQCVALTSATSAVTLATADRGLIARVRPLGVDIVGPRSIPRR